LSYYSYIQIDAHGKLTEHVIDARAKQQSNGGGAKIILFLVLISVNYCIVINRRANFGGDRGVRTEMMPMKSTPYIQ
jgi:hypothetical protein